MLRGIANGPRARSPRSGVRSRLSFCPCFLFPFPLGFARKRSATFPTEAGLGQIFNPAARTAVLKGHATPDAELHPLGIGQATRSAAHAASLLPWPCPGK